MVEQAATDKAADIIKLLADKIKDELVKTIYENVNDDEILEAIYDEVIDDNYNKYRELCSEFGYDSFQCDNFLWWVIFENALNVEVKINTTVDEDKIKELVARCRKDKHCWFLDKTQDALKDISPF